MRTLAIDIETFSSVDLTSCGVYTYTAAPDFQILLFGYAWDDDPVELIDLACGERLPDAIVNAIESPEVIKTAFNAGFERICLSKHLNKHLKADSWRCTAIQAAMLGLPLHLDGVGTALKLKVQKDRAGKDLIRYFSIPCKSTKSNGGRTRNLPHHAPEKWQKFKDYCVRDVEVEREVRRKIERYPIPEKELKLWLLDQKINDTGVLVDMALVNQAVKCDTQYSSRLEVEAKTLTKLDNPNSVAQLKEWLKEQGLEVESLSKQAVQNLLTDADGEIERLLTLRQEMAKSSIAKYAAVQRSVCPDSRVRGLFQFYGANRTGRWAGRIFQIQNLPQNHMKDLEIARMLVKQGRFKELELLYESVPIVLSELIRTVLIPEQGCRFIVADFSAIEARVLAWLANEAWVLDTFKGHGKIYEQTASRMFGVPVEKIAKGNPEYELRAKGKVAVLACGYQGGVNALKAMGADKMGLSDTELDDIVRAWRSANQRIVRFWYDVEKAAVLAVREREPQRVGILRFKVENGILFITLPSGRRLAYIRPKIEKDLRFDKDGLTYEGLGINKQWWRQKTYGGRLVENIVQGAARDCLAEAMLRVDAKGYKIVGHVHDEIITEMRKGQGSLEELCGIMGQEIPWALGLPLRADGFETMFYKKE
ncbi:MULTISPECIES: DNA polymerase [Oscillospiraceae]|uniref:DNA-directed DNA polymerase n=1 Tax=Pseudobacteroides cellulosolvens ATCC 35603 = DSM 2933 TaxID=398512 RepID=A0A0L6JTQ0_9FIRM|nr:MULTISPECIES: DNA polymerase [Oscillospiraceae]KNY29065.1 DNA-directed DNA polymerase [Pseudobacteroides cellulosolvens ATCC 35603 = DSM 2933]